jgi:predicted glycosyltransferase
MSLTPSSNDRTPASDLKTLNITFAYDDYTLYESGLLKAEIEGKRLERSLRVMASQDSTVTSLLRKILIVQVIEEMKSITQNSCETLNEIFDKFDKAGVSALIITGSSQIPPTLRVPLDIDVILAQKKNSTYDENLAVEAFSQLIHTIARNLDMNFDREAKFEAGVFKTTIPIINDLRFFFGKVFTTQSDIDSLLEKIVPNKELYGITDNDIKILQNSFSDSARAERRELSHSINKNFVKIGYPGFDTDPANIELVLFVDCKKSDSGILLNPEDEYGNNITIQNSHSFRGVLFYNSIQATFNKLNILLSPYRTIFDVRFAKDAWDFYCLTYDPDKDPPICESQRIVAINNTKYRIDFTEEVIKRFFIAASPSLPFFQMFMNKPHPFEPLDTDIPENLARIRSGLRKLVSTGAICMHHEDVDIMGDKLLKNCWETACAVYNIKRNEKKYSINTGVFCQEYLDALSYAFPKNIPISDHYHFLYRSIQNIFNLNHGSLPWALENPIEHLVNQTYTAYCRIRELVLANHLSITFVDRLQSTNNSDRTTDDFILRHPFKSTEGNFDKACEEILKFVEMNLQHTLNLPLSIIVIDNPEYILPVQWEWWKSIVSNFVIEFREPLQRTAEIVSDYLGIAETDHAKLQVMSIAERIEVYKQIAAFLKSVGESNNSWRSLTSHILSLCNFSWPYSVSSNVLFLDTTQSDNMSATVKVIFEDFKDTQNMPPFFYHFIIEESISAYCLAKFCEMQSQGTQISESQNPISEYIQERFNNNSSFNAEALRYLRTQYSSLNAYFVQIEYWALKKLDSSNYLQFLNSQFILDEDIVNTKSDLLNLHELYYSLLGSRQVGRADQKLISSLDQIKYDGIQQDLGLLLGSLESELYSKGLLDRKGRILCWTSGSSIAHIEALAPVIYHLQCYGYLVTLALPENHIAKTKVFKDLLGTVDILPLHAMSFRSVPIMSDLNLNILKDYFQKSIEKPVSCIFELWPDGNHFANKYLIEFLEYTRRISPSTTIIQLGRDIPGINKERKNSEEVILKYFDLSIINGSKKTYMNFPTHPESRERRVYSDDIDVFVGYAVPYKGNISSRNIESPKVVTMLGSTFTGGSYDYYRQIIHSHGLMTTFYKDCELIILANLNETPIECIDAIQSEIDASGNNNIILLPLLDYTEYEKLLDKTVLAFTRAGYSITKFLSRGIPIIALPLGIATSEQYLRAEQIKNCGLLQIVTEEHLQLSSQEFAAFVEQSAQNIIVAQEDNNQQIQFNGAEKTARIVDVLASAYYVYTTRFLNSPLGQNSTLPPL